MINKVVAIKVHTNSLKIQQNTEATSIKSQPDFINQEQKSVSFEGLGAFIAGIFRKPDKAVEAVKSNDLLEKSRQDAIKDLLHKEAGMYILQDGIFVFLSDEQLGPDNIGKTKEIIAKDSPDNYVFVSGDVAKEGKLRLGIIPVQMLHALDNNVERLTVISDVGIQTMKFPQDPEIRKKYFEKLMAKKDEIIAIDEDLNFALPTERDEVLYEKISELITDMPDISLELIPLKKN